MSGWWAALGLVGVAGGLAGRAPAAVGAQRTRARLVADGEGRLLAVPSWPVAAAVVLGVRCLLVAPGVLVVSGVVAGVVAAGRARPRRDAEADLAAAFAALEASLAVGASVRQAIGAAATRPSPVGRALGRVAAAADAGAPLGPALDAWAAGAGDPAAGLLADALAVAGATGADPTAAVRTAGDAHRRRSHLRREVRALAAQAQASAVVLVAAPVAFLVLVAGTDASVRTVLVHRPLGWACLVVGVALDGVGAAWMAALLRRVGR